jgi:hypothetical protein
VRILVVEDEPVLARHVADGLADAGFAVDVALDADDYLPKPFAFVRDPRRTSGHAHPQGVRRPRAVIAQPFGGLRVMLRLPSG